jgi:hypothetical protein
MNDRILVHKDSCGQLYAEQPIRLVGSTGPTGPQGDTGPQGESTDSVLGPPYSIYVNSSALGPGTGTITDPFNTFQAALAVAVPRSTIYLTGTFTVAEPPPPGVGPTIIYDLNIPYLTIQGLPGANFVTFNPMPVLNNTIYQFYINERFISIKNIRFQTIFDATPGNINHVIHFNSNAFHALVSDCVIQGPAGYIPNPGPPGVLRATAIAAGAKFVKLSNNTIRDLRQPCYNSSDSRCNAINNLVFNTRGWVIEQQGLLLAGNSSNALDPNDPLDIAILATAVPPADPYIDIRRLSAYNQLSIVQDQRVPQTYTPNYNFLF